MDRVQTKKIGLIVACLVIALLIPQFVTKPYYLHVITMCLLWAYLAASWNIFTGFAGPLSLGHGIYTAIGAYVTIILFNEFNISPWIGMFVGAGGAVLMSLLIGFPTFKLRGAYYALSTVAIGSGVVVLIENTTAIGNLTVGGAEGLTVKLMGDAPLYFQFMSKEPYYYIAVIMVVIIILVSYWIKNSRLGYYLSALKEDEDAAAALGINVRVAKLKAVAISAFFTALGGVFYAMLIRYLEPVAIAGPLMSNQMVFLAIVGGSGTVFGPIIGGITLSAISELVRFYLGSMAQGLHLFIYGIIVVLMIMFKPQGLIEFVQNYYNRFLGISHQEEVDEYDVKDSSGS
ncbi:MAG: branched-chain amino acid ABC transporter permease [Syntrophomonadaceae bacterium]|nr:branched-chain amino acid ABC transporter permease [Syntrophomonadaceae bacterium]